MQRQTRYIQDSYNLLLGELHLIFPFYNYKYNDENQEEEGKCLYNNYNEMVSNCENAAHMLNRA